jgi:hypothetical protein
MRIWLVFLVSAAMMKAESARTPVLVELFTSEGCSSCPPADFLLSHLQKEQPIPGVQVISLSEHVDYWNQLGWADPFSSPGFTERQQKYSDVFHRDGVYTPQMVVDGKAEFVGSDSRTALRAIGEAAKTPKASVGLSCGANPISLQVRIDNMHSDADVLLAIAESSLQSNVTRGENRGRLMEHDGVTRRISIIGRAKRQQAFTAEPRIVIDKSWRRENLSAVVFLQDRYSRRVLGAGMIAIPGCVE